VGSVVSVAVRVAENDDLGGTLELAVAIAVAKAHDLAADAHADQIAVGRKTDLTQAVLIEGHCARAQAWRDEVLADLMRSNQSIMLKVEKLQQRRADAQRSLEGQADVRSKPVAPADVEP